jgi:hypothetical protein
MQGFVLQPTQDFPAMSASGTFMLASVNGLLTWVQAGGGGLDQEAVEDLTGGMMANQTPWHWSYDDSLGRLTLGLDAGYHLLTDTEYTYLAYTNQSNVFSAGQNISTSILAGAGASFAALNINATLRASANSQLLVGLSIYPSFNANGNSGVASYLISAGTGVGLRIFSLTDAGNLYMKNITGSPMQIVNASATNLFLIDASGNVTVAGTITSSTITSSGDLVLNQGGGGPQIVCSTKLRIAINGQVRQEMSAQGVVSIKNALALSGVNRYTDAGGASLNYNIGNSGGAGNNGYVTLAIFDPSSAVNSPNQLTITMPDSRASGTDGYLLILLVGQQITGTVSNNILWPSNIVWKTGAAPLSITSNDACFFIWDDLRSKWRQVA